ncbi:hypothetical protein C5167_001766 [Papaver somniferum]|uniref:ACB domain-containing protein n=1 Tax=Papaver somniferum TaxID=3469 RepID=A0A4Y7KV51_PAPSO|nr:hypothetical protein C5167_001766 [Papaver somniferum]
MMMINIMGGDWQEITQSIIIGLIFSFLIAKLISMVISIKDANLKVTREQEEEDDNTKPNQESTSLPEVKPDEKIVESDEKRKSAATTRVQQLLLIGCHRKYQMMFSWNCMVCTEGPCTSPQPSAIKMTARVKWNAWQKLGAMPPEDAMEKYITIVSEIYPAWISGSSVKKHGGEMIRRGLWDLFSAHLHMRKSPIMNLRWKLYIHLQENESWRI